MKTSLIVSLVVLAVVLAGGVANTMVAHRVADQYVSAAEELLILTEDGHWDRAGEAVQAYQANWDKTLKWLQILVNHDDADDVTLALLHIASGIRAQDRMQCILGCAELRENAQHIYHRDSFTIGNVL